MNKFSIADPRTRLPAGTYYIGDPCYVIKDEDWMDVLHSTNYFNLFGSEQDTIDRKYNPKHLQHGVFACRYSDDDLNVTKYLFAASGTKYGDGEYPCRDNGNELGRCGVDAGLIAAVPVDMIEECGEDTGLDLGVIHDFDYEFGITEDDGKIRFGHVTVHTEDEDEDDEW